LAEANYSTITEERYPSGSETIISTKDKSVNRVASLDFLSSLFTTVSGAYRECMDINEFLTKQRRSLRRNEEACVNGVLRIANALGVSDSSKETLLERDSYKECIALALKIRERLEELSSAYGHDPKAREIIDVILALTVIMLQKLTALKLPATRSENIIVAYGVSAKLNPYVVINIAYVKRHGKGKPGTITLLTTHTQLWLLQELASITEQQV